MYRLPLHFPSAQFSSQYIQFLYAEFWTHFLSFEFCCFFLKVFEFFFLFCAISWIFTVSTCFCLYLCTSYPYATASAFQFGVYTYFCWRQCVLALLKGFRAFNVFFLLFEGLLFFFVGFLDFCCGPSGGLYPYSQILSMEYIHIFK